MATTAGLLEREPELECLRERIDAALSGVGSMVAVEGPAGIGKSSLLGEAARFASDRGMQVLHARGGELEREFAYGVVRQLFEPALVTAARDPRERLLTGAARFAAPALGLSGDDLPTVGEEHATLHGLYWLTANLAEERPLLLVLDDGHWADPASLRFVSYVARRVQGLALMLLYAGRAGEGTSLSSHVAAGLVSAQLWPGPLSELATADLVGRLLGDERAPELASACHAVTAGNPFLLRELVREIEIEIEIDGRAASGDAVARWIEGIAPQSITRATLIRLQRLGPAATDLAFAVAVVGTQAQFRHASVVAGLEPEAAEQAWDALSRAEILGAAHPPEFVHPIVRSAVYAEIAPARRTAGHRYTAELLERDGLPPDALAPHLMACEPGGDAWVVEHLRTAAAAALRRGAPDAACAYLERARKEPPAPGDRAAVLLESGSAELRAGRSEAVGHLRVALACATATGLRVEAATELTLALTANDRGPEAVRLLDAAIGTLVGADREARLRLDALLICIAQVDSATAKLAHERLGRYAGALRGESTGERLLLASLAFEFACRSDPREGAVELAQLALTGDRLLAEQRPDAPSFYLAGLTLAYADELDRAVRLFDQAVSEARARGSLLGFAIATGCRSLVLVRQGRIAETEAEIRGGLEASFAEGWPVGMPMLVSSLLDALAERARPQECEALLRETGTDGELPTSIMASMLLHSRGHLRLAQGDPAAALRDFAEVRRRDDGAGLVNAAAYNARASMAIAYAQLGDRDAAGALAREGLDAARRWGAPSTVSFALRALAGAERDDDARITLLREATATVAGSPARYERARALSQLGTALRRCGHPRDARAPLRAALDLAQRCGATRLAGRAREELVAAGGRPRRTALTGRDALTASERRIAGLASDGLSNREIAQALFVTARTVETHLSHIYSKLALHSRDDLAAVLREEAATEPAER